MSFCTLYELLVKTVNKDVESDDSQVNLKDVNDRILINSKTVVDQIEVDTLKEFANCPQANAFRRVVFSILYDLPQHHLFQSYLRSRGFDVSISKEKFCHEGFN